MSQIPIFDRHNDVWLSLHYEDRGGGRSLFKWRLNILTCREPGLAA